MENLFFEHAKKNGSINKNEKKTEKSEFRFTLPKMLWCNLGVTLRCVPKVFKTLSVPSTRRAPGPKKKWSKTKHKKQFDWLDDIHALKRQMKLKWNKIKPLGFSLWALNWGNWQFQSARPFLVALVSSTRFPFSWIRVTHVACVWRMSCTHLACVALEVSKWWQNVCHTGMQSMVTHVPPAHSTRDPKARLEASDLNYT